MLDQPLGSAKRDFAPSTDLALTNNRYHYNSSEFVLTNIFYLLHFAFLQVIKLFFFFFSFWTFVCIQTKTISSTLKLQSPCKGK